MSGGADRVRFRVVPEPHAPGAARHALSGLRSIPPEHLETAKLLVTELVTNSVRHAGLRSDQSIGVTVTRFAGALRIEVTDQGPGFDRRRPVGDPLLAGGGRGLMLLDRLSDRWDVSRDRSTRVWFELDVAEARAPARPSRPRMRPPRAASSR